MEEDRQANQTPPAAGEPVPQTGARRYWLEYAGRTLELRQGVLAIGRSSGCQIVLDDALVSRRHADLLVAPESLTVQDSGSVNGVYVNGKRVVGAERLKDGDQLRLGTQNLLVRSVVEGARPRVHPRFGAETLSGIDPTPLAGGRLGAPVPVAESEATFSANTLDLLGGVAEKVLALGRGEEAEKVLATTMTNLLADVRNRGGSAQPQVFEKAVHYALKLAEVTGKGRWVDYAFELYSVLKRPLPAAVVDELYTILRRVDAVNLSVVRAYVAEMRALQQNFGPTERFVLQRLEGFERLAALK
ncbi:MAG: FHA domain-containing protein [Polyangiaceae bacterium]